MSADVVVVALVVASALAWLGALATLSTRSEFGDWRPGAWRLHCLLSSLATVLLIAAWTVGLAHRG